MLDGENLLEDILLDDAPLHLTNGRGLRQGDPLSPYLFILCPEAFSALLSEADLDGSLKGVCICDGAPRINHLFFVDDPLIVMKATMHSVRKLNEILKLYEMHSGQMINKSKSSAMFSKGMVGARKAVVLHELGKPHESRNQHYLGLSVILVDQKNVSLNILRKETCYEYRDAKKRF